MGDERDSFYVVKKGDMIGVYKSISDLQALLRSSVIYDFLSSYICIFFKELWWSFFFFIYTQCSLFAALNLGIL